ncbi:MAG: hypothetical protein ACRD4W_11745 [Nitrososphaeraceae archaeon]
MRGSLITLIIYLICPLALFCTHANSQEQVQSLIQNISQENLAVSTFQNTTNSRMNDTITTTNPVTIGALTSVAMNKVILNVTQNVLNETARILELKEFVLRVSAQESGNTTLNLNFSALDSETSAELAGVSIDGWIANGSGVSTYFFSGLTDNNGRSSFTFHSQADELYNTTLTVEAYLRGYSSQKQSAAFSLDG